jgi:hypothetical protein
VNNNNLETGIKPKNSKTNFTITVNNDCALPPTNPVQRKLNTTENENSNQEPRAYQNFHPQNKSRHNNNNHRSNEIDNTNSINGSQANNSNANTEKNNHQAPQPQRNKQPQNRNNNSNNNNNNNPVKSSVSVSNELSNGREAIGVEPTA